MKPVEAYFDGSYTPLPDDSHTLPPDWIACGGWVVKAHPDVSGLEQDILGYRCFDKDTVDVPAAADPVVESECAAAEHALKAIARTGYLGHVILYGDNERLVGEHNRNLPRTIHSLDDTKAPFTGVEMALISGDENEDAHRLAERARQDELIHRCGGRMQQFRLIRSPSGLYVHRYIECSDPPVVIEAAGPIEKRLVLDEGTGKPRSDWYRYTIDWHTAWDESDRHKAAASVRNVRDILSIVTVEGAMIAGETGIETWLRQAPPQETKYACDRYWYRRVARAVRDTIDIGAAGGF